MCRCSGSVFVRAYGNNFHVLRSISHASFVFIKELCPFSILLLLDSNDVNLVLASVAIVYLFRSNGCHLKRRDCFRTNKTIEFRSHVRGAVPLKRVLLDGTEEWRDGGEEICLFYCSKYKSRGMTQTFIKAPRLRYIAQKNEYNENPSPKNPSIDVEFKAKTAKNVEKARLNDRFTDVDEWALEGS